jgi:hypothetical protein
MWRELQDPHKGHCQLSVRGIRGCAAAAAAACLSAPHLASALLDDMTHDVQQHWPVQAGHSIREVWHGQEACCGGKRLLHVNLRKGCREMVS